MNGKSNPKIETIKAFVSKTRTPFLIFKKGRRSLFRGVPNISDYGPISLSNARICLICLNVPWYGWTQLNIAECPWICLTLPEQTVLTMPGFSICRDIVIHNNINIIVINDIVLEFLSARFIHPVAPDLICTCLTRVRT